MQKPLRTLFFGVTHEHAYGKLATLRKLSSEFEIVAVVDDRESSKPYYVDVPVDLSGLPVVGWNEALRMEGIDVVFIETTNRRLMEVAEVFAARGIPMHCDKPCGEEAMPYRRIVDQCRARNLPFQIGYMYRGNPALKAIWTEVRRGLVGDVSFVEADMNHDYGSAGYPGYVSSFRGGIIYNLGCHLLDIVEPLVGGAPVSVTSRIGPAPGDPAGSGTRGVSLLSFAGTDVLIRASSHAPGGIPCRRLRIDGSNGTIDLCPIERFDGRPLVAKFMLKEGRCGHPAGESEVDFGVQTDRYADQLLDLAAIVRGAKLNDQDYDRDIRVHELTLMICKQQKGNTQ